MERPAQRGYLIAEAAVAVGIAALIGGALLFSVIAGARWAGGNPVRDALQAFVQSEMRIALDVAKYGDATLTPSAVSTTLPMPTGSPLAVTLALTTANAGGGALRVTIAAKARHSQEMQSLSAIVDRRAPLPGISLRAPGLVPAPTGAP
jgi:hypothetical protein